MKQIFLSTFLCFVFAAGICQWNSNTSVNLEAAGVNAGPILTTTTSDGKTYVVFYSQVTGSFDMRVQLLDRSGNKLFGPNGIVANNYSTGSATYVFNTCLGPDNSLIIACQDQRNTSNGAVIIRVNENGTLPWGVGGLYLGAGLAPYPALLSNGEVVVAWNDTNNKISYQKVTTGGTLAWATARQVQLTVGTTVYGSTAAVPVPSPFEGGGFTIIMQRRGTGVSGTLYAQRYNNNGDSVWTSYLQLSNATVSTTRTYSVAMEGDTIYYGYYSSTGSRFNSYVQRINPNGTLPWGINGAPFSTYTGTQPYNQTTNIAHAPGSPYVWSVCTYTNSSQSQNGVYVQKFDAVTGARLFNADGKEIYPISASLDQQTSNLALVNDAPLFMTYDASYKIYATRLDASGNFVWPGNRIELSSTTASLGNPKGRFNFTPVNNNQAVAVWNENRGTENRAYAQNISSAGATGPLPVRVQRFTAIKKGNQVQLAWATGSEENSKGFFVQRSVDGNNFINLQFVTSKATNGTSSIPLEYTLPDLNPAKGSNYYRLQQIDKDDKASLSRVVPVWFDVVSFYFHNVYPNPVTSALQCTVYSAVGSSAELSVIDAGGSTVLRQPVTLKSGANSIKLQVIHLPKGNYQLLLNIASDIITQRWIKQ